MKTTGAFILILTFALIAGTASAERLCQLDWFEAWKNASGALSNYRTSNSRGDYDNSTSNGGMGTWAVTSDQGSAGVYHTVSGQSFCSSVGNGTFTNWSPDFDTSISSNNKYCWCRMTSPNLGGSWAFLGDYGSAADCAIDCALHCANCVRSGADGSCNRSAVLALP
ncbi:MAG: hypothetical protein LBT45_03910 [Rickettsiales bacterium]|jgi:hypothetical protein|nr:hypothetical protein [Rickettsiales bacterium]